MLLGKVRWLLLGLVVVIGVGVIATRPGSLTDFQCPITQRPTPRFIPPEPYPEWPISTTHFWYGTDELWTELPINGVWDGLPYHDDHYGQKSVWWRVGYDWQTEPVPPLTISGRQLDGDKLTFESDHATNAYHPDVQSFMLAGIEIPVKGCWEITGRVHDQELTYIVQIEGSR